jgi:uridine phosphorylase
MFDRQFTSISSARDFHTYTGTFNQVPVSIIATGMGIAMADFVARELRACVDATAENPIMLIRLGTCGSMAKDMPVGSVAVAQGSMSVHRNPMAFGGYANTENQQPYFMFPPIESDSELTQQLLKAYADNAKVRDRVFPCLNVTGDSFYSSQGRQDANFDDQNQHLIENILAAYPAATTLEMETFHFLDMAHNCLPRGCFRASASTIVLAQRRSNDFITPDVADMLEIECGRAVLTAVTSAK